MATSRKGSTTPKELKEDAGGLVAGGGPDLSGTASQPSQPPSKPKPRAAGSGAGKATAVQPDAAPASKPRSKVAAKGGAKDAGVAAPSAGPGMAGVSGQDGARPSDGGATPAGAEGGRMSDEERQRRIAERAYQKAQERGFAGDRQLDDWLEAEREHNASEGRSG
jgi:hypothetical protein